MPTAPGKRAGMSGGSVPLEGEAEIIAQSTGFDILTLTHSTNADSRFLVCRTNLPRGSTRLDTEVFAISSNGTILQSRVPTADFSSVSTSPSPASSVSGTFYTFGGYSSPAGVVLPTPAAGLFFNFFCNRISTGAVRFTCNTTGIIYAGATTGADAAVYGTTAGEVNSNVQAYSDGTNWYLTATPNGSSVGGGSTVLAGGFFPTSS